MHVTAQLQGRHACRAHDQTDRSIRSEQRACGNGPSGLSLLQRSVQQPFVQVCWLRYPATVVY